MKIDGKSNFLNSLHFTVHGAHHKVISIEIILELCFNCLIVIAGTVRSFAAGFSTCWRIYHFFGFIFCFFYLFSYKRV